MSAVMSALGRASMNSRSVRALELSGNGPLSCGTHPGSWRISHIRSLIALTCGERETRGFNRVLT